MAVPLQSLRLNQLSSLSETFHPSSFEFGRVIGPTNPMELAACPCCQCGSISNHPPQEELKRHKAILDCIDDEEEDDDEECYDSDEEIEPLPGGISEGVAYQPKRILVEGWLHKKGTGKDWLGSRSWKPRWARLVMASMQGYDIDVPLLMIYWYAASAASTVIVLDSTVVFPVDKEDKTRWDAHRFDVRNAKVVSRHKPVNRTFAVPKKARDAWVYAISQALLMYEKENDRARKALIVETVCEAQQQHGGLNTVVSVHPANNNSSISPYDEVWMGDRFQPPKRTSSMDGRLNSPPTSPRKSSPGLPLSRRRSVTPILKE